MSQGNHDQFRLGFLTAVEDADKGFVGGLLITNRFGRPLEFQCTAPVKPSRTQQILYGPTLKPYVLGELIGRTLLEKVGVKPHLVMVETDELLDLRTVSSTPVASLVADRAKIADSGDGQTESPAGNGSKHLKIGVEWVTFHSSYPADETEIEKFARTIPDNADLREPFERVREALLETIRLSTARSA